MPKRKEPVSLVEKIRQQVLTEYTRVPGEDYEDWCEFVRFEVNARMREMEEYKIKHTKQETKY